MATSRWVRYAPLSGIFFFTFMVIGYLLTAADSPNFVDKPDIWAAWFVDEKDNIIFGGLLVGLAVFALLWFLGSLRALLRQAEGADDRLSAMAFGGGVTGAALLLAGNAVTLVGAFRVDDQDTIPPDVAAVFGDLGTALGFIGAPIGFAVLLAGTALVGLRTRALPMWLSWVSFILAAALLVPFIAWAALFVFLFWVLVLSLMLFIKGELVAVEKA